MATIELDIIKSQSIKLLPKQRLELIRYLSESLASRSAEIEPTPLKFGKYRDTGMSFSSDDDFALAEWNPTEGELNGD